MTYSTYSDIIDNVTLDTNRLDITSQTTDGQFVVWINEAQKKICELARIEAEFSVELITGQTDYPISVAPSEMRDIIYIRRIWGNFKREIVIKTVSELLRMERDDSIAIRVYTDYDAPRVCALWTNPDGDSYIKFYPAPVSNSVATVYYLKEVDPVLRNADATTVQIQLPSRYNIAIQNHVKYNLFKWMGDIQRAQFTLAEFDREIKELNRSKVNHSRMHIVYS